jgi:hypothetical protein
MLKLDALSPLLVIILFVSFFGHRVAILVADFRRPTSRVGLHLPPLLAGNKLLADQTGQLFLHGLFPRELDVLARNLDAVLNGVFFFPSWVFTSSTILPTSPAVLFIPAVPLLPAVAFFAAPFPVGAFSPAELPISGATSTSASLLSISKKMK